MSEDELRRLVTDLLDLLIACECPHGTCHADHGVEDRARVVVGWSHVEALRRLGGAQPNP